MAYALSKVKQEAEVAKAFVGAVLTAMDKKPAINSLCYDLEQYRNEADLARLSLRRAQDLVAAAKGVGLLVHVSPAELTFVRLTGDEHKRTDSLTKNFRKSLEEL